jgi:amino acid permease
MSKYEADPEKNLDPYGGGSNGSNPEKVYAADDHSNQHVSGPGGYTEDAEETHRSLKPRQISMIAIGGAIGTYLSYSWRKKC